MPLPMVCPLPHPLKGQPLSSATQSSVVPIRTPLVIAQPLTPLKQQGLVRCSLFGFDRLEDPNPNRVQMNIIMDRPLKTPLLSESHKSNGLCETRAVSLFLHTQETSFIHSNQLLTRDHSAALTSRLPLLSIRFPSSS